MRIRFFKDDRKLFKEAIGVNDDGSIQNHIDYNVEERGQSLNGKKCAMIVLS